MLHKTAGTDKMINRKTLFGGIAALSFATNLLIGFVVSLQRSVIEQQKTEIASLKADKNQTSDLKLPAGLVIQNGTFVCQDGGSLVFQNGQVFDDCLHSFERRPVNSGNELLLSSSTLYNLGKPLATMTIAEATARYQKAPLPIDGSVMVFKIGVANKPMTFTRFHRPIEQGGGNSSR